MANKRDTSKQKRARQNRAQREAVQARTKAAAEAPEVRRSKATSAPTASGTPAKKQGFFSAASEGRPPRPGDTPVDVATLEGNWITKRVQVPGGRQVLTALLLTLILTVLLAAQKFVPEGAPKDAKPTVSIFDRFGALAFVLLGVPLIIVAIAAQFSLHPKRRRIWTFCAALLSIAVVGALGIYFVHLIVVGYLIYAISRAAKIEGPVSPGRARGGVAGRAKGAEAPEAEAEDTDEA